jgi:hypothetical protein
MEDTVAKLSVSYGTLHSMIHVSAHVKILQDVCQRTVLDDRLELTAQYVAQSTM